MTYLTGLCLAAFVFGAAARVGGPPAKVAEKPPAGMAMRGGVMILDHFPYQYLSEKPGAAPVEIRADSNKRPAVPFLRDAEEGYLWEAWICHNAECPRHRPDGRPNLFPLVDEALRAWADGGYKEPRPMPFMQAPQCPACREMQIDVYHTPEGKKAMDEYREWVMKAYGR